MIQKIWQSSLSGSRKESHAKITKDEITTIWGDYFKQPQFEKFPEIHDLTHLS